MRYLELRTIPRALSLTVSKEEYIQTILNAISAFKASTHDEMSVFLIFAIDRGTDGSTEALQTANLALANRQNGVVGIDICGNPTKGDVAQYGSAIRIAKAGGLGVTVHFGETPPPFSGSREELSTLLSYEPDRLGHVIYVAEDLKEEIAERRLGLELCMSCNVHAGMIEGVGGFLDHHFGFWRGGRCPIALCVCSFIFYFFFSAGVVLMRQTDDVGFFCSPVSNEYLLAASHFGLGRSDVMGLCRGSVDVIFGGEKEKERLRGLLDEFENTELVSFCLALRAGLCLHVTLGY